MDVPEAGLGGNRLVERVPRCELSEERIQVKRIPSLAGPPVRATGKRQSFGDSAYSSISWPSGSFRYAVLVIT
jgi:hypothetical protein